MWLIGRILTKLKLDAKCRKTRTLVFLFITIVVRDPAPLGWVNSLPHWGSVTTQLLVQLISRLLGPFGYAKLQQDVFHLLELSGIFFHIGYSLPFVTSVLSHPGAVKQSPDTGEHASEGLYLHPSRLWQPDSELSHQTTPESPYLFSLPLRNLPVGLFGDQESRVRGQSIPGIVEGLLSEMFFEKSLNPVDHMLQSPRYIVYSISGLCRSAVETLISS